MELNGYTFRNILKKTRRRFALSAGEQALYMELVDICNEEGWQTSFQVSNGELITALNCTEKTICQWRQSLINAGLIKYSSGKSKRAYGTYDITVIFTTNDTINKGGNTTTNKGGNPSDYNKLNKTKLNNVLLKKEPKDEIFVDEVLGGEKQIHDLVIPEIPPKEKSSAKKEKFTPPTVQQVQDYCNERQNGIQAFSFVSFYQSKGWMVGKNQMKDWKAAIHTWESKNKEHYGNSNTTQSSSNGNGYSTGSNQFGKGGKITASQMVARARQEATARHSESGNRTSDAEILS